MDLNLKEIEEIHSFKTESDSDSESNLDSLSVSSDEFDFQADNIEIAGEVIKGQYAIIKKIGKGSYANVWLAYDITNNRYVAIKVQHPDNYKEGVEEITFLRNIRQYNCQYINNLYEAFIEIRKENNQKKKYICMVGEILAGNLYDVIKERQYDEGLPINIVKSITKQMFEGIKVIHKKVNAYHADLKPENILIKGVSNKNQEIIDLYNRLNFAEEYKTKRDEFLTLKKIDLTNKQKIKKMLTPKIKSKIKSRIHKKFMEKIQDYISDDSSDEEDEYSNSDIEDDITSDSDNMSNVIKESTNIENKEDNDSDTEDNDSDIEDNDSDSDDDDDEDCVQKIDDKYILNCEIKITDFGSICYDGEEFEDDFGTRYYRAPEIILGHKYDKSCDIWSLACVIYELLTGDLLFDPKKDKEYNRDMQHICLIEKICGKFPKDFIKKCEKRSEFFDKKGKLPKIKELEDECNLEKLMEDNFELNEDIINLTDLLKKMLNPEPNKRINIDDCLKHPFFLNK